MIKYSRVFEEKERTGWGYITRFFFVQAQQPVAKIPSYVVMDLHAEKKHHAP